MAAYTATSVYATTPTSGIDFGAKSSTPAFKVLTKCHGSNGFVHIYVKASEALASTDTVLVRTAGSCSSDSGSAGWTLNAPGGLTAGQFGWARRTSLA